MAVDTTRGSLQSRSVRLFQDTLDSLKKESDTTGIGVTTLMREIIERYYASPVAQEPEFQVWSGLGQT